MISLNVCIPIGNLFMMISPETMGFTELFLKSSSTIPQILRCRNKMFNTLTRAEAAQMLYNVSIVDLLVIGAEEMH